MTMPDAHIAVIMPVTRTKEMLTAIASVVQQSCKNWTLYLVSEIEELPKQVHTFIPYCQDKIRILFREKEEKVEWAQPRNYAMSLVDLNTTHMAFIDDDDIWFPDHLESCLAACEGSESIGLRTDMKRFVVSSFYKIRHKERDRYLLQLPQTATDFERVRWNMYEDHQEHSGQQPYLSLMRILNPDTIGATCMFIPISAYREDGHAWIASQRPAPDERPLPGEDLRFAQSMLLDNYTPIWIKTPTCANLNYYGLNYVPSGEPDDIVVLGHVQHHYKDTRSERKV